MESAERLSVPTNEPGQWRYWAYRIAASVVPRVPYAVAAPLASATGLAIWAVSSAARSRVEGNLARVPVLADDPAARAVAARGVFRHLALNYLDLFRAHALSEAYLREHWQLDGVAYYDQARAAGRGVILITGHTGNFDLAAARLGIFGTPITIPVERLKPARLFTLVCQLRTHHSVRTVPADTREGLRALLSALRRGEAVLLTVDRDVVGSGAEVSLFGAPASLPTGAVLLARRSGAPLLWASGHREDLRHSRGGFVPVELPAERSDREAGLIAAPPAPEAKLRERVEQARLLEPVVCELERQIAAHPEQWVASLARIWREPTAEQGAFVSVSASAAPQAPSGGHPISTSGNGP